MRPAHRFVAAVGALLLASTPVAAAEHGRDTYAPLVRREAAAQGLPADIADAVLAIESGYDPDRIGGVGEIGLMQVRPGTARMLGFSGTAADLAVPAVNIHYGVTYLASAWRQAGGDLCRALMKYRAGHGEEVMTPLSVSYCVRARAHLAAIGSPFGAGAAPMLAAAPSGADPRRRMAGIPRPNIRLRGAAFWAPHDARVKAITARIERRWRRMASG